MVRILRLEDRYSALPVVSLTTRGQVASQIEGARAGGDAYLVKPVSPGLLLSVVSVKLDRGRLLKSLLDRDGLTRLLTHSAFMDQARVIWEKCRRKEGPCAVLVMIDLDHFKAVNDTHGHPVGDRVLTNLARFLRKRLRGSDLIGRYGGEEFALIIEDLDAEVAAGMVERLREEFAGLEHDAYDGRKIRVTFSAGVAPLERKLKDLADWTRRADDALYEAKMAGRNRVAVSSPALEGSEEVAPARGVGEGA